jgi:hypothetical protein
MVFENKVLRIFGPKRGSNKKQKKKLYNKDIHKIYYSPNTAGGHAVA